MRKIVDGLFIPGTPKTKGSLKIIGYRNNGSAILGEQVRGSSEWRALVAAVIKKTTYAMDGLPSRWPVKVTAEFGLARPASCKTSCPTRARDGDLDKYARNVGDALTDSGIIRDDSQIVCWETHKRWVDDPLLAGVTVTVTEYDE